MNSSGRFAKLALAALAVVGTALLAAGCSSTDTMFPAVHDMPAARTETTLTPDEVKQATDNLVSERNHLDSEAQTKPRKCAAGRGDKCANDDRVHPAEEIGRVGSAGGPTVSLRRERLRQAVIRV